MGQGGTLETVLLVVMAAGILFWFAPSAKRMVEQSRNAEKDWPGFLIPIAAVVGFVVLLVMMV